MQSDAGTDSDSLLPQADDSMHFNSYMNTPVVTGWGVEH